MQQPQKVDLRPALRRDESTSFASEPLAKEDCDAKSAPRLLRLEKDEVVCSGTIS